MSRGQIAALRGVNVDGVVRLLEQRGYIAAVGHAAGPGPARPLRHHRRPSWRSWALAALDQLPPVEDLLPGPDAMEELEERLRPGADA